MTAPWRIPESATGRNFFSLYLPLASIWALYDNAYLGGYKIIAEKAIGQESRITDTERWQAARRIAGETVDDTNES